MRLFQNHKTLFLWCIVKLVVVYMLQNTKSDSSAQYVKYVTLNTAIDELVRVAGNVNLTDVLNEANNLRTLTNINCVDLLESLYYSGRGDYWNWLEYFYDVQNHPVMNVTPEMLNPLVLPRMFSPNSPAMLSSLESCVRGYLDITPRAGKPRRCRGAVS